MTSSSISRSEMVDSRVKRDALQCRVPGLALVNTMMLQPPLLAVPFTDRERFSGLVRAADGKRVRFCIRVQKVQLEVESIVHSEPIYTSRFCKIVGRACLSRWKVMTLK